MDPLVVVILIDIVAMVLALATMSDKPRFQWATHPLFVLTWFIIMLPLTVILIIMWAGTSRTGSGFAMLGCIFLAFPQGLLLVAFGSRHLSRLFTYGSLRGIKSGRYCDRALAAVKRGNLAEAESLFRESLKAENRENAVEFAAVHLAFGNFLAQQERFKEAVAEWRQALLGDLMPNDRAVVVARACDALIGRLNQPDEAAALLREILEKHPDGREAAALRARLERLENT